MTTCILTLTPREVLAIRIAADSRNIETWKSALYSLARLAPIAADCAVRFVESKQIGDRELLRKAECNLAEVASLWREYNP